MSHSCLNRIFQPRTVAVIGASRTNSSIGQTVFRNLTNGKFKGNVYPVNPKYDTIDGQRCYTNIGEISDTIDLAVVCTPAEVLPCIVDACGRAKVFGMVVLSAGFREVGPKGLELEQEIGQQLNKHRGLRIIGPNCLGILSPHHGLNASFAGALPKPGRIAFLSQSGALCTAVLDWAIEKDMGFSLIASFGNALDVDVGDLINYAANDSHTESIVLYLESIQNAPKFMSAARAFIRTKPIVAYKAGRFAESAKAAASHTGALAGEDRVYDAALARAGIVRVTDMGDLFSSAEVLACGKLPSGRGLAIVTNAGGPGIMAADALLARKGVLATLSDKTVEELNQRLPMTWSHRNPVDIIGDAMPDRFAAAIQSILSDKAVDGVIVLLSPQAMTDPIGSAEAIIAAAEKTPKPILCVWMGGASVRVGIERLNHASIPTFDTPEQAVRAFTDLVTHTQRQKMLNETPQEISIQWTHSQIERDAAIPKRSGLLTEIESKAVLAVYDLPVNRTLAAASAEDAVRCARTFVGPVALKILSADISHKSDVGGVELNIAGDAAVLEAYNRIVRSARLACPEARIEGVSVQPMVLHPTAVELIVGVKREPTFGATLLVGSGGTLTELMSDSAIELQPLDDRIARRMLQSLRIWPLLIGYRNRPAVNVEELVKVLIGLSYLVAERSEIVELDINPLVIAPDTIVAVDARMVLELRGINL